MLSIKYYLSQPFKDGVTKEDIKALKSVNKPIGKYLNDRPTVIYLFITFTGRKLGRESLLDPSTMNSYKVDSLKDE